MFTFLRSTPQPLTLAEVIAKADKGEITVLDVREIAEVRASGKAAAALHLPLALVPLKADPTAPDRPQGLDLARPVAVYCASGIRSGKAVAALQKLGYDAQNIGGFSAWVAAGGPVTR